LTGEVLVDNIKVRARRRHSHFGYRRADGRGLQKMGRLKKEMFVHLQLAKRHFGYQADERLKPKCPFGALRSSARRYTQSA